jgi:hypothetical protein
MICWLFFNFSVLFDFGCCSLAQEISLVDCYLPNFRQWLITHPLSALLLFQPLYTLLKVHVEVSSLPHSPYPVSLQHSSPLLCVHFQFLVYCSGFFFCGAGGQSVQGTLLVYLRGGCGNTVWHLVLTCWSAECLPSRFGAGVWWQGSPPVSQCNVVCRSFLQAEVRGDDILILLGALFMPRVAPASQQDFWFTKLTLPASVLQLPLWIPPHHVPIAGLGTELVVISFF